MRRQKVNRQVLKGSATSEVLLGILRRAGNTRWLKQRYNIEPVATVYHWGEPVASVLPWGDNDAVVQELQAQDDAGTGYHRDPYFFGYQAVGRSTKSEVV